MTTLTKKQNRAVTLAIWSIILGFLLFSIYDHFRVKQMFGSSEVSKSFGVAVITDFNGGARNAPSFRYSFQAEGEWYTGRHSIVTELRQKSGDELRKYIGRKFKVWYVVEDPSFNQLLLDQPISDEGSEK